MSKMKRLALTLIIVFSLFATAAHAFAFLLPAAAEWILTATGGSVLLSDLVVGLSGAVSGLLWADCTYQWTSCSDKTTVTSQATAGNNANFIKARINLGPTAARTNPNTNQWDNAVAPARDPTPKTSFTNPSGNTIGLTTVVSGLSSIYSDIQANGYAVAGGKARDYKDLSGPLTWYIVPHATTPPSSVTIVSGNFGSESLALYSANYGTPATDYYTGRPPVSCPTGYTLSGSTCTLAVAASTIQKPATTPCELLWDPVGQVFLSDSKNTNCSGVAVPASGSPLVISSSSDGTSGSVQPETDGSMTLTKVKSDGSWVQTKTAPYDAGQGGYPIISASSGTGTPPSSGGTTGGVGGGGTCGGAGQPECGVLVDDTGIPHAPTLASEGSSLKTAMDGMDTAYSNRVNANTSSDHGVTWASIFPDLLFGAPVTSCHALSINLSSIHAGSSSLGGAMSFDWCSNPFILMFRSFLYWALYVATIWYIWRRFMSAEVSVSESSPA